MTHARTLPRYVGIAGLVAGLLAPVPSLAANTNGTGLYVMSTSSTGVKTGQYIEAQASMRYSHFTGGSTRLYTKQMVPIATSTLRKGAIAALGRGFMHPGLAVAITAAGFLLDSDSGQVLAPDPEIQELEDIFEQYQSQFDQYGFDGSTNLEFLGGYTMCTGVHPSIQNHIACYREADSIYGNHRPFKGIVNGPNAGQYYAKYGTANVLFYSTSSSVTSDIYYDPDNGAFLPATDEQLEQLDSHIPHQLYDELVNSEDDIPEWRDTISLLPGAASTVMPTNSQNVAPEVATAAGRWAENMAAQLEGQPAPNPDANTEGKTADEAMYESTQQPIPPFGEVKPEWQVETIDTLPSYSIGLGSGSCPAPSQIALPFPFSTTIELDWTPICDLASMIRGAVIGVCMILSLYIVLRGA